jgi:predicted nucleic acid-binding protein
VEIVVDASVAMCWFLPDEYSEVANIALELVEEGGMAAPILLRYELQNVLLTSERRKRIEFKQIEEGFRRFAKLPINFVSDFDPLVAADIARRHGLSAYDTAYLEIALRRNLMLATLDRKLAKAALAEGLEVLA